MTWESPLTALCIKVYNANTGLSALPILDAVTLSGPIATVPLNNHIPHCPHRGWIWL
jgi:carotenoid cleavage dioxygenase-like enzyme